MAFTSCRYISTAAYVLSFLLICLFISRYLLMNKTEINFRVAELLGLGVKLVNGVILEFSTETGPYLDTGWDPFNNNYVDDPVQREPLEDALLHDDWSLDYDEDSGYCWNKPERRSLFIVANTHRGTAACVAFIEMMENK